MLKIPNKYLPLTMMLLGTLLASLSTIANADTLVRKVLPTGGDHSAAGGNAIIYTIGQPIVSINLSPLQVGFLPPKGQTTEEPPASTTCPVIDGEVICVEFQGLKPSYKVGDFIKMDIVINVQVNRFSRVDLWIGLELPGGVFLFKNDLLANSFAPTPLPFKKSLENQTINHRLVDLEVVPGLGGSYTFYGLYVNEGENPMEHLDDLSTIQRSNFVLQTTTLANE
ncbi:MAG TPA: hypothetical protein ENG03_06400 [Thioploca sp.]|nr:MAG: hypothetical protein DRR19_08180 [Gammaproteobacteria bacterium]HDN26716.1 hypothetical protein [Thioploca sp.]